MAECVSIDGDDLLVDDAQVPQKTSRRDRLRVVSEVYVVSTEAMKLLLEGEKVLVAETQHPKFRPLREPQGFTSLQPQHCS